MWIVKGIAVGVAVFLIGTFIFLYNVGSARAIGSTAIEGHTIQNPLFWLVFMLVVAASCALFRALARKSLHATR
jgi:hypothetical protein